MSLPMLKSHDGIDDEDRHHGSIDGIITTTTARKQQQETSCKSFWRFMCPNSTPYRISLFVLFVGLLLILFGLVVIHPSRYVCGSQPPSAQEIEARGAPLCLTTSVRPGAMCLQARLDPNEPAIWCQEKMAKMKGSRSYYLWWWGSTSCDECNDGSWRMAKDVSADPAYMALEPNQPKPDDAPLNLTWQEYTSDQWTMVDFVEISECDLADVNDDGIPNACFADKQIPLVWLVGLVLVIFSTLCCLKILAGATEEESDRHASQGRKRRDLTYWWGSGAGSAT